MVDDVAVRMQIAFYIAACSNSIQALYFRIEVFLVGQCNRFRKKYNHS
jgi:hypothetical protein